MLRRKEEEEDDEKRASSSTQESSPFLLHFVKGRRWSEREALWHQEKWLKGKKREE